VAGVGVEIRAISKLNLAGDVREQKMDEAQMLAGALLDAEAKIGDLTKEIPKDSSFRGNQFIDRQTDTAVAQPKPKKQVIEEMGLNEKQVERFEKLSDNPDIVEQVKAEAEENDDLPTRSEVLRRISGAHVGHNTGEFEWYTPSKYIESARFVMGKIDLDPASSETANKVVKADKIYTVKEDGLKQEWFGSVWLNPPYSQPLIDLFCEKITSSDVKQACVLVNNATETAWGQRLLNWCSAVCFVKGRVRFIDKHGKPGGTPLQGQMILYFGSNRDKFKEEFLKYGVILWTEGR